jgi:hypothetical protein
MKKWLQFLALTVVCFAATAQAGLLKVSPVNPRYFADSSGNAVYLTGSHTWENLQDISYTANDFNWIGFLDFLELNNHNFFRLWAWEEASWATFTTEMVEFSPVPFDRLSAESALDGKPKFDLTSFNQAYFNRLRQRVIDAGDRGIYVSVMLFNGWSVETKGDVGNPWQGHPFNKSNNINGINGDPNNDNNGNEIHKLQIPAVTAIQEAYVRKVVDTVNDLDNVLYEICNECNSESVQWQYHMIDYIKSYEAGKPKQHPVGMTAIWPFGNNADLFASNADWISPNAADGYDTNPPASNGSKVIIVDSDHLWGIGGDRYWAWKSFTRGMNVLFMDVYDFSGSIDDATWGDLRRNLGYIRAYAEGMNLVNMVPTGSLASSGYALSSTSEYLVYLPSGGSVSVNLAQTPGTLSIEWFRPATGSFTAGNTVTGGATRQFTAPFSGDAVLHLVSIPTPPDTTPPSIPAGFTVNTVSQTQVYFSWAASTDNVGVAGYKIFRDTVQIGNVVAPSFNDSNLAPATTYRYNVSAYDAAGNASAQSSQLLVKTLSSDAAPIISNIRVVSITGSSAKITWITDKLSNSAVDYGKTTAYGNTAANGVMTTSHSITLYGLSRATLYHYRVRSGSAASSDRTFWTRWR